MRKEYYDLYKSMGLCTCCGKNKAEPNRVLCLECAVKDSEKIKKYDKIRKANYSKRKRELCDAFGVCTTCMTRDKYKGKRCMECYLKAKRKYREKQNEKDIIPRQIRVGLDVCFFCGEEVESGHKVCAKHLKVCLENASNARKFIDKDSHKWRKDKNMEILRLQSYFKEAN